MGGIWLYSYVVLWVLVLALALLAVGLIRQVGLLHIQIKARTTIPPQRRSDEPGCGPQFTLNTVATDGRRVSLDEYLGRPVLLVFASATCGSCSRLLPDDLKEIERLNKSAPITLLVNRGMGETNLNWVKDIDLRSPVVADVDGKVSAAFGVEFVPHAILLDDRGQVHAEISLSATGELLDFIRQHRHLLECSSDNSTAEAIPGGVS